MSNGNPHTAANEYCAGFKNGRNAEVRYIIGVDDPATKLARATRNNESSDVIAYWKGASDGFKLRSLMTQTDMDTLSPS